MEAWKLRAFVYGALALVSVLILWKSGALAGSPPRPRTLTGSTSEGSALTMRMSGADLTGFDIDRIYSRCSRNRWWRVRWYPGIPQGNVTYRRAGLAFAVHERAMAGYGGSLEDHINIYMRARETLDGGVAGTVWYTAAPYGVRCRSRLVRFAARPHP